MTIRKLLYGALFPFLASAAGSEVCTTCHKQIAEVYRKTPMARSSSLGAKQATVTDAGPYHLEPARKGVVLRYPEGDRLLEFTLGSGNSGHSYLFRRDGYLFQAPVSYYSSTRSFDHSPGYPTDRIELTRAVEPACLQCHTSRWQPVAGTQNRYADPPFLENGVSCERCHGDGAAHAQKPSRTNIVNPVKLQAERRDSVCGQCHLTGAARLARANAPPYTPGARLRDHLAIFLWTTPSGELTATSHYEKLEQSACKKSSGDKLWCGSCHSPHPATPVSFDAKCAACHAQKSCKAGQRSNCASCHMPKGASRTVDHLAFTDHSIPRRPQASASVVASTELKSFWPGEVDPRDLALGYAVVAPTTPAVRPLALQLLQQAAAANPKDVPVLAQLAMFYERMGREPQALELTERIHRLDPEHQATLINLGGHRAKVGQLEEAIALWRKALLRNPALSGARLNLAVALYQSGKADEAREELRTALDWDPALDAARKLLAEMR